MRRFTRASAALAAAGCMLPAAAQQAHPLLTIPDAPGLTQACERGLERARKAIAAMDAREDPASILDEWNDLQVVLEDLSNPVDLFSGNHPDKAVREAGEACTKRFSALMTDLMQDEKLFRRLTKLRPANAHAAKYRKDLLDAFEDSGVSLPVAKRAEAKRLAERIEEKRQAFDRNVREDATKVTFTAAEMEGLPEAYLEARKPDAAGNYVLGLDQPSYGPFMENARSEAARERYYRARFRQGGEKNLEVLCELFALRKEVAALYGLPTFAHYGVRRKMAQKPENVDKFLRDVKAKLTEVESRELDELRAAKAKDKLDGAAALRSWDVAYYQEAVRRARFDVDQQKLRRYFPADKSVDFALLVASRLYGVKFTERTVPTWHPDVRFFEMFDAKDGRYRGAFYADLFPRDGKRPGAAAYQLRNASLVAKRTPMAALVANFDRGGFNQRELETLLHELGHVMHMLLSRADYGFHGGANVKWDFVEAPSQMFEEWARREQSLALFREVCADCPRLGSEEIARLNDARRFGQGIAFGRQWLLASLDMELSREPRPPLEVWKALESAAPLGYVEGTIFPASFRHIAGAYAAGYYGYMWSRVIALDMLSPFKADLLDPGVGARYRDALLAPGGQEEEGAMVRRFLGREPSSDAFFAEITGKR